MRSVCAELLELGRAVRSVGPIQRESLTTSLKLSSISTAELRIRTLAVPLNNLLKSDIEQYLSSQLSHLHVPTFKTGLTVGRSGPVLPASGRDF